MSIAITSDLDVFDTDHVGALIKFSKMTFPGNTEHTTGFTGIGGAPDDSKSDSLTCGSMWRLVTKGTWSTTVEVEQSTDGESTWQTLTTISRDTAVSLNIDTYGSVDENCYIRVGVTKGSGTFTCVLSSDPFLDVGIIKITSVTNSKSAAGDAQKYYFMTGETDQWAWGAWNDVDLYPGAIGFIQDRLCFAGSPTYPQTEWCSETSNYLSFKTSSPLLDTDAISVSLPSRTVNQIKHLIPFTDFLALTSSSEWGVGAGSNPLTPATVKSHCFGNRGASDCIPAMVGNRAIYVAPMGGVVRDIGYDINADGFTGEDISIYANHLFKGKTVVEMAYAQEPDSVVYCVMSDGTMNTLTYVREHEVLAWTHQETGGGDDLYESVCTIPGDGFDEVWVIVNRNGGRYVEKFVPRDTSGDIEDQFYVHSGIIYDGAAATTISGLDHLEGETVAILADGYVLAQQVVSSGDITLATAATKVIVGLPYTSDVETLNIELNLPDGTTQDRDVLVGEVTVRFLDSRGGWIGPDSSHLDEVVQITDPPMGEPTPLYTGDFKQELNSQYDKGGRVFYRQVDPLPFTILSLIPVVTVGD